MGAGTVDYNYPDHPQSDVNPWLCALLLDGNLNKDITKAGAGYYMEMYLTRRPADNRSGCATNKKSSYD